MSTGAWVLVAAVVAAVGFGLLRGLTDGRFRGTHRVAGADTSADGPAVAGTTATEPESVLAGTPWAADLGKRATFLQFSSAFCAPCRSTRHILADVATATPGVAHVEVDAEHHLDVVRRLGIMRTPTTLVLDSRGVEVTRATGAPTRDQVRAAIPGSA